MVRERNIHNDYLLKEVFSPSCVHALSTQYNITFFHRFSKKKKRDCIYRWKFDT